MLKAVSAAALAAATGALCLTPHTAKAQALTQSSPSRAQADVSAPIAAQPSQPGLTALNTLPQPAPQGPTAQDIQGARGAAKDFGVTPEQNPAHRLTLLDHGVTMLLNYTGEAAANPSGGIRQGADYAGQLFMGADFDMQKLAGIPGATLHFAVTQRHGRSLTADDIGNNTSVQEIWGTQNTHLAIFTWQQDLFDKRLQFEVGRSTANIAFLNSPLYCNFQTNSACGNPTFVFKDSDFTYFPASSWAGHAYGWITQEVYVHAGAYEVNPDRKTETDNGFSFDTRHATGVVVPYEFGYSTDRVAARLPHHYAVGGWFDQAPYNDPLLDSSGRAAVVTGEPGAERYGRSGVFFRFDQTLTRLDPNSNRGLTVFGVGMYGTSGRLVEKSYLELGVVQLGVFPGRDLDTVGFVVNDQRFSHLASQIIQAAQTSIGGDVQLPHDEVMMELAYGTQLSPAVRVSPNLQYIVHPDTLGEPFRTQAIPNAFVVGFKFTIDAASLINGHL